jgi:hypothetical protein
MTALDQSVTKDYKDDSTASVNPILAKDDQI